MPVPKTSPPRGLLTPGPVQHSRWEPAPALAPWIAHYWAVAWRLPAGESLEVATLPHPCVHWTTEAGTSRITGPQRRRFVRTLHGTGAVSGVKFRPGGFADWLGRPVHPLADTTVLLDTVISAPGWPESPTPESAEAWLLAHRPSLDPTLASLSALMDAIETDRTLTTVAQLAELAGRSPRSLQRWFRDRVGLSPKAVLQRYRLLDALDVIAASAPGDLAGVALSLGYADQAHFTRDFTAIIGQPPGAWRAALFCCRTAPR